MPICLGSTGLGTGWLSCERLLRRGKVCPSPPLLYVFVFMGVCVFYSQCLHVGAEGRGSYRLVCYLMLWVLGTRAGSLELNG